MTPESQDAPVVDKSKIENTTIQQVIRDRFMESKEAKTKDLPKGRK